MVLYVACFWLLLPLLVFFSYRWGGRPERQAAIAYLSAAVLTVLLRSAPEIKYAAVELKVVIVDVFLLGALITISLKSNRWWPLCSSALQAITVAAHLAKGLNPELWRLGYALMLGASSYPSLIVLMIGILANRARMKRSSLDFTRASFREAERARPTKQQQRSSANMVI